MDEAAREYITMAAQLSKSGCFNKSFDLYMLAFEKNPELKALFEPECRLVLTKLNKVLVRTGKTEEIFLNYGRAMSAFPDNIHLYNDLGKYLYDYGYYAEAWCHFQKALLMDSSYVNAEKNLNSIKNLLVERWNYRMLNDKVRNETYHRAIRETVLPHKDTVIDLGCGTGLLTLYVMKCHPIVMTACDGSEQMAKMASCIFEDYCMTEVVVVNEISTDLDYRDIGGKRSLLVTEMFDAGLFGEHCLQSLSHAHQKLIAPKGRVLPKKAEFFVIGAKCDHLYKKYQLSSEAKDLLNIPSLNINIKVENDTGTGSEDSYDCEDVYLFKDLEYMTEPKSLLTIDFNDYNDIQEKLNRTEPYEVSLKTIKNGEVNVIIGWFTLHLTDTVSLTTDPRTESRANAWQQAVFYDFLPQRVREDQIIDLEFLSNSGKLTIVPKQNDIFMRISNETLRYLNDSEYIKMIRKCLGMASVYLGQMADMSEIAIVDLCPFPVFGFLMLKRGVKSLTCCAKTASDETFFKKVFEANKIPLSKVNLLVGQEWTTDSFLDEKYHAIFCNILDLSGDPDSRMVGIATHLRNAHLMQGGLVMPASVSMVGQVVNSPWLSINNKVFDTNVCNYKIGVYINRYQVSQNYYIDLSCLKYTALTEPINLGKYGSETSGVVDVPIIRNGDANAILCWYSVELMEGLGEVETNRGDSFVDGTVFLADPPVHMVRGDIANILRCVDLEGATFKLMLDVEAN